MSADRRAIHDAYRRTTYRAAQIEIRVGEVSELLDATLRKLALTHWAFVTAMNPHAQRLGDSGNAERHAALVLEIEAAGLSSFEGESVGDDRAWPPERSVLILGISEADALRIARGFDQEAIVVGELGEPARLVFCGPPP